MTFPFHFISFPTKLKKKHIPLKLCSFLSAGTLNVQGETSRKVFCTNQWTNFYVWIDTVKKYGREEQTKGVARQYECFSFHLNRSGQDSTEK
jgi:hypothetical protein